MGKNKLTRLLALCLAVVCLIGVVGALSYDLNGDGKTNVWDLQTAVNSSKTDAEKSAALAEVLGGGDEMHPNANGEYEIYSMLGMYNMAQMTEKGKEEKVTFKLMNDIDMEGAAWKSTLTFDGIFEGNGHVICNANVVGEIALNAGRTTFAQGFFGKIGREGAVRNLKLENVNVILTEESQATFVGLLTGSVVGEIHNCTTVGTVIDPRTTLPNTTYIGTLTGRVENTPDNPVVGITYDDQVTLMTAETPEVAAISGKSQQVLCKMGMEFGTLSYPEGTESGKQYKRQLGIAGWAPNYDNFKAYNWQDISGATTVVGATGKVYDREDPVLTARRDAVVAKMYEICTVEWTPSQDMTIYYYKVKTVKEKQDDGTYKKKSVLSYDTKTWKAGTTYYGMPYNHGSGSLERFEAWMQEETDSQGRLVTKTELPTEAYYYTYTDVRTLLSNYKDTTLQTPLTYTDPNNNNKTYDLLGGFKVSDQALTIGQKVQSADHAGFSRYVGNDCSQAIQWAWREVVSNDVASGGTVISGVTQMCPTTDYQARFGVLPVGGIVPTEYDVAVIDDMYNKQTFMKAYAQASKGDALIVNQTAGGHSRMIAYDPICIYTFNTKTNTYVIDETNSYLITHEQGNSKSGYNTTCNWNRVLTFQALLDHNDHVNNNDENDKGVNCAHYFPVTLPAFHNTDSAAVTSNVTYSGGVVKSNFFIISTTVDGNEVFTAIGQDNGVNNTASDKKETIVGPGYREAQLSVELAKAHGDVTGKTITVRLSNGDIYTVNADTGVATKTN